MNSYFRNLFDATRMVCWLQRPLQICCCYFSLLQITLNDDDDEDEAEDYDDISLFTFSRKFTRLFVLVLSELFTLVYFILYSVRGFSETSVAINQETYFKNSFLLKGFKSRHC